jgi:iron complex outermembrane receptor protein
MAKPSIKMSVLAMALLFYVSPVCAQDDLNAKLDEEFKWLQAESVVFTEIATKTKMDADLVPGIVTVLQGKDLKRRGFRTVLEALALVPGLDFSLSFTDPIIIVRGAGGVLGSGKLKLMLNNVPMNNTLYGKANPLYNILIEQISRIEVIRGPGSALYGKWAYAGVINVITHNETNKIFSGYGRFDTWAAGGAASYIDKKQDLKISLNAAYRNQGRTDVKAGPDSFYGSPLSNTPGPVNDSRESLSAVMNLAYKDISLTAQYADTAAGNYFGIVNVLPPPDDEQPNTHKTYAAEAGWKPKISESFSMDIRLGWREYVFQLDRIFQYPPGLPADDGAGNILFVFEDGLFAGPYYKERSFYGGADFHWNGWKSHNLLLGGEYEHTEIREVWHEANYHPIQYDPLPSFQRFHGDENWLKEDEDRKIFSLYIQDQFEAADRLTLTAGLRYDNYDDTDNRITPRIAGCFRLSGHHIFKAQYSEAFRPPSFFEMYSMNNTTIIGNPDINPETVRTYEAGYIYKSPRLTGRLTLFYSELKDLIVTDDVDYFYKNSGDAETKGAEAEFRWKILPSLTADANVSYADTEDDAGNEIEGSAKWLGNIGLIAEPAKDIFLSAQYHYVGKRARSQNDDREKLDGYNMVSAAATVEHFMMKGLTLSGGGRNLFDSDVRYPSPTYSYIEDYPQPGREWWVQLSYEFE